MNAFLESVGDAEAAGEAEAGGGKEGQDAGKRRKAGGANSPSPRAWERVGVRGDIRGSFEDELRRFIQRRIGEPIPEHPWNGRTLPDHLRMNFRVVDDAGRELAVGRDLLTLKGQLGQAAQLTFGQSDPGIERSGIRDWDFGDLPEKIAFPRRGRALTGYPALVDEGTASRFASSTWNSQHRLPCVPACAGCCASRSRSRCASSKKSRRAFYSAALQLRTAIAADVLKEDLLNAIADRAFIADDPLPRTRKAFDAQRTRARARLPAVTEAAVRLLAAIAEEYQRIAARIASARGPSARPAADMRDQLSRLVYAGFLSATPWERLSDLPRVSQAMLVRLDKFGNSPERETKHAESIAELTRSATTNDSKNSARRVWPIHASTTFAGISKSFASRCSRRSSRRRIRVL